MSIPTVHAMLQPSARTVAACSAMPHAGRQQGAAIVTALLVVALASVIVTTLFYRESVAVRSIENRATLSQTRWIERAVIDWAKVILRSSDQNMDWAGSIWATPVVETQLDETVTGGAKIGDSSRQAMMAGKIHDAQARFNANAVIQPVAAVPGGGGDANGGAPGAQGAGQGDGGNAQNGDNRTVLRRTGKNTGENATGATEGPVVSVPHQKALKRLMGALSLPEALADQIVQRVRRAAAARQRGGAVDGDWVMPLLRFDDLRDLPGFNDDVMLKLEPHLTVLPDDARTVNVNTASLEVLEAVADGWNPAAIRSFVANRDVRPANNLRAEALGLGGNTTLDSTLVDVKSAYFIADGIIRYDRVESHTETLLKRSQVGAVQVIWQHRN
ncbi:MAG: type II secretion system minor pseudopilin GspK [Lautropia sp.]|nr:type II secretion system minor pseudopilin GspK [Lautropia sp.]